MSNSYDIQANKSSSKQKYDLNLLKCGRARSKNKICMFCVCLLCEPKNINVINKAERPIYYMYLGFSIDI